jgi:hypothetical protein
MEWFKEIAWIIGPLLISLIIVPIVIILILRWIGAWMFRINDIINLQKEILEELKK